jgi:hypothetical protein
VVCGPKEVYAVVGRMGRRQAEIHQLHQGLQEGLSQKWEMGAPVSLRPSSNHTAKPAEFEVDLGKAIVCGSLWLNGKGAVALSGAMSLQFLVLGMDVIA